MECSSSIHVVTFGLQPSFSPSEAMSSHAITQDLLDSTGAALRLQENLDRQHGHVCMNAVKCLREVSNTAWESDAGNTK